ncbi:UNVERIFIED_CONTAM: hypothetical protein RMT77_013205 [Armadillidium vulgare]
MQHENFGGIGRAVLPPTASSRSELITMSHTQHCSVDLWMQPWMSLSEPEHDPPSMHDLELTTHRRLFTQVWDSLLGVELRFEISTIDSPVKVENHRFLPVLSYMGKD